MHVVQGKYRIMRDTVNRKKYTLNSSYYSHKDPKCISAIPIVAGIQRATPIADCASHERLTCSCYDRVTLIHCFG